MLRPESNSWPILQFEPGGTSFLVNGECIRIPISATFPPSRFLALEQAERDLALGRHLDNADSLLWNPPERLRELLAFAFECANASGGLRVSSRVGCPPIEAISTANRVWCETFPILHLSNLGSLDGFRPAERADLHTLVYFNPAGEPLPIARKEAEQFCREGENVRGIFRTISEEELAAEIRSADRIIYLGHAKCVAGRPAVPGPEGFIPFVPREAGPVATRSFLLLACLEAAEQLIIPGGRFIRPVCRIADRRSEFPLKLMADSGPAGFLAACQNDALAGDVRRFIYRLQGSIWF
ncbi:MAG: hypothetical protein JNM27_04680 [Leptospirales bacterium]|nr:hypothetical protein [Leptospirales bacterium]